MDAKRTRQAIKSRLQKTADVLEQTEKRAIADPTSKVLRYTVMDLRSEMFGMIKLGSALGHRCDCPKIGQNGRYMCVCNPKRRRRKPKR